MRYFSASPLNRAQEDRVVPPPPKDRGPNDYPSAPEYSPENLDQETRSMYDLLSPEDRSAFDQENHDKVARWNDPVQRAAMFRELDQSVQQIDREADLRFEEVKTRQTGFWAQDEPDEFGHVEDGDEEINDDEMTSMAHAEVELHREMREYARITAWDMPMLSSQLNFLPLFFVVTNLKSQSSPNHSPCLPKVTFSASATLPSWVRSTRESPRSS